MDLDADTISLATQPAGRMSCAQCGEWIGRPAWAERAGADRVRYLWSCRACGYEFETLVGYGTERGCAA